MSTHGCKVGAQSSSGRCSACVEPYAVPGSLRFKEISGPILAGLRNPVPVGSIWMQNTAFTQTQKYPVLSMQTTTKDHISQITHTSLKQNTGQLPRMGGEMPSQLCTSLPHLLPQPLGLCLANVTLLCLLLKAESLHSSRRLSGSCSRLAWPAAHTA